jgi:uncharacterized protein
MSSTDRHFQASQPADWRSAGFLYHNLNFFYRKRFGAKVRKLSLDAGCNCPNRDGVVATLGCIFCDPESFSPSRRGGGRPIAEQLDEGIARLKRRYAASSLLKKGTGPSRQPSFAESTPVGSEPVPFFQQAAVRFVAYFQPGTNTYGPIDRLRLAYQEALTRPDVVGLAVGTRPDCVAEPVLDLLAELASRTWVVVEYGLQTIHDRTLDLLNRGHHYDAFLDAYQRTQRRNLDIGVHVILGLPGESPDDMLATARELARLKIHSLKLHNLYAVRNTVLAEQVAAGQVRLPQFSEYIDRVVDFLEVLPGSVVIERLCGDAPPTYLVAPTWCLDKAAVRSAVEAEFRRRGSWQGCKAK